jgi:hypothetical protein
MIKIRLKWCCKLTIYKIQKIQKNIGKPIVNIFLIKIVKARPKNGHPLTWLSANAKCHRQKKKGRSSSSSRPIGSGGGRHEPPQMNGLEWMSNHRRRRRGLSFGDKKTRSNWRLDDECAHKLIAAAAAVAAHCANAGPKWEQERKGRFDKKKVFGHGRHRNSGNIGWSLDLKVVGSLWEGRKFSIYICSWKRLLNFWVWHCFVALYH